MTQNSHQDQYFSGAVEMAGPVTQSGSVTRTGRQFWVPAFNGKAGATAGWVVEGADDGLARLPASQTAATLIIPLLGLHIGDTLTGVSAVGQVESAGNNGTLVMSVRKTTAAAADFVDVELDTGNIGTVTADTLISSAGTALEVTALTEVLAEGEHLYALLTSTTGVAVDIALAGLIATYSQA